MSNDIKTPQKVLVIRFGALGDLIHVSPSFRALKVAFQDQGQSVDIHLLTSPGLQQLVEQVPHVDRLWTWDKKQGLSKLVALGLTFRQQRFDALINLHPSLRTWGFSHLAFPRQLAVYRKEKIALKGIQQRLRQRRHAVEDFYQPFRQCFPFLPDLSLSQLLPDLRINSPSQKEIVLTKEVGPVKTPEHFTLGIIPGVGGKRANRRWPVAQWKKLLERVDEQNRSSASFPWKVNLIGGPEEAALGETLKRDFPWVENHCGQHDLNGTIALLRACTVVVAADTGPTHLADALDVPVIGLYAPTNPMRSGPARSLHAVITPPSSLECWPCEHAVCPLTGDAFEACMQSIDVDTVFQKIQQI
jgi:heptosyltransferase I